MIYNIIAWSVKNKLIVALLIAALVAGGIWSITKVPIDAVPDITNNQVQIITQAPNLGTEDIERFITYPIELSMANLPDVIEIRSVSRFGLSLITVVFEDDMGTYLPRQLVAEKLSEVKEEIPSSFGVPNMGPISTGLGEIYQYTLNVDQEHNEKYSPSDLRTFQDWIIKRQMAMVPGVIEVNGFGGDIKQYEVSISPDKLNSVGLDISDLFKALENNNQNVGGAYIEKNHRANYIRGEGLLKSIEDIESVVVKNEGGIPITIGDVAKVKFGKAVKYGAFTKNGQGEAVGGMIMMLKGANSNDVIQSVKKRMTEIQKSLPEGVFIEPFLDRSNLIENTTSTVTKNLLEGAIIVILVLIFLLGNWRGGLIVASTIPLSLLFAFILMNVFDVWANLMSLGAIDFGIIVDGAVIIVESTVFIFYQKLQSDKVITQDEKDELTIKSSNKLMNSAFFGQLIILIVFIPILSLEGIEGKMFKPMALTFIFAMIGVMFLCLTYVPAVSALFLKVTPNAKKSIGDKLIYWLENKYEHILAVSLKKYTVILSGAGIALILSIVSFNKLGGEFIPKLDESDIAFHVIMKPGTSLSETITTTTRVEKIIKSKFPEVVQVLSRIGVADVPTDPMPMDVADCFIILKPQEEWTNATSKPELIDKLKEAVQIIPGVNFEFSQPIEMRFNELITGVREDIAIKLFGDDLEVLASKAEEIGKLVGGIQGVGDLKVEATQGLPQITIKYNRAKIAQYGLTINQVNNVVETSFAGGKAGVIYEGEYRFNLVVRLEESYRQEINNLRDLYIKLENGSQIPLKELASIEYLSGPMQISRDNTNRRTYVGINARDRDIQSLVTEIKEKLDAELELPVGYYIRYGGAFENLERASNRLKVVVPIALGLIFILIFLALKSVKQSLMIYIAIPLSTIGGVFALYLRGMPFSISAGVGFIVLFGVAVLNGLVLISAWNDLKENSDLPLSERIALGAKRRIRPILLTALTDILGFLPMAISSSAGAEVQRPLATVVIGGMISATLLTLIILPILYRWLEEKTEDPSTSLNKGVLALLILGLTTPIVGSSQSKSKVISSVDQAIEISLNSNLQIRASETNVEIEELRKRASWNLGKTDVKVTYGQLNSEMNDTYLELNQNLEFPTVYSNQKKLALNKIQSKEYNVKAIKNDIKRQIRLVWNNLSYNESQSQILELKDSLYTGMAHAAKVRYETEATAYLEYAAAEMQLMEVRNELNKLRSNELIFENQLRLLLNDSNEIEFEVPTISKLDIKLETDNVLKSNPEIARDLQQVQIAESEKKILTAKMLPEISVGYFNQTFKGMPMDNGYIANNGDRFQGVQAGLSIPLFYGSYRSDIKTANLKGELAQQKARYHQQALTSKYEQLTQESVKHNTSLEYYESQAVPQSDLIIKNAELSYKEGAISYIEFFQIINYSYGIKTKYINELNRFNENLIELNYLSGR